MIPVTLRPAPRVLSTLLVALAVGIVLPAVPVNAQARGVVPGGLGYDISWPQCGHGLPYDETQVAVVGVNDGRPFTANPCLSTEVSWARGAVLPYGLYLNLNWPDAAEMPYANNGPRGACASTDVSCQGYNYGWNAVGSAARTAASAGASAATWWLDVETGDNWSANTTGNSAVVQGAIDAVRSRGLTPGIYSISFMWRQLTNGYQTPTVPVWIPGPKSIDYAGYYCNQRYSFDGGPVWLVQYPRGSLDGDLVCTTQAGWPAAETWHGAGYEGSGPLGGAPVVVAPSPGVTDIFWKGTDGQLWHTWQNGSIWTGPQALGGQMASDPSAVSPARGVIDVFWKGTDGQLWHKWFNSAGWQGPSGLGGVLGTSPQAVGPGSGVVDVFWRGPDHALMHAWYNQGWHAAQGLGAGSSGDGQPFPETSSPGVIDVFWRGADSNLWHVYYVLKWYPPSNLGDGPLGSDPHAVGWQSGHIEVAWRGTDGGLWEDVYGPADGWLGYRNLTASGVTGEPVPISWGLGDTDIYWLGADGSLWHHWYGRSERVGDGPLGSRPSAVVTAEGAVRVVWKGTDANLWTDWYG